MFDKILIANRGEIACRVIRTARRLGIRCVAVYSDADRDALHVAQADEAVRIGPPPATESYLSAERIVQAARHTGAAAIHPGYGFLSENAAFAETCESAGLVFVGPPADAIRAMGSKIEAKKIMEASGVPTVPGYHGDDQDAASLEREAQRIGWPVLIKASAGGGGKGMRIVREAAAFRDALTSARREARSAFGDDRMLLEKYLQRPRHIEVQVFADRAGDAVHLFERDCSVQRRHQKIIEEAPAPGLSPRQRERMGQSGVAAARAIGYVGAGTVEFIAEDGEFYFMEMNTRLQVEHPVTELVTGQDLVEWQLRVAAGEPLPCRQSDLQLAGHAIEARIYAEDPGRDFLPATGTIVHLAFPPPSDRVRVDTGVRAGDVIGVHYDPMIAKLIVSGDDREAAVSRMLASLGETRIVGPVSNIEFLKRVVALPAFAEGRIDTTFVDQHAEQLQRTGSPAPDAALALACLHEYLVETERAAEIARNSHDPWSPWHSAVGWRLNEDNFHVLHLRDGERDFDLVSHYREGGISVELPGATIDASVRRTPDGDLTAEIAGHTVKATVVEQEAVLTIFCNGERFELRPYDPFATDIGADTGGGSLRAPMPGKIVHVSAGSGDKVGRGQVLLVLEAMKMEHAITAPADGTVDAVHVTIGDVVEEGAELLTLTSSEADDAGPGELS